MNTTIDINKCNYRIVQTSPHGTGSTLLANILTGLFYDKESIHWISANKPYNVKLKHFITKVHKLDINNWIQEQPSSLNIFYVISEREKRIDDKYRQYDNVLIFQYKELLETTDNTVENIVTNVYKKMSKLLPQELVEKMKIDRAVQRVKDMNALYETIKDKPMTYLDTYYHLHGSHRGRRKSKK